MSFTRSKMYVAEFGPSLIHESHLHDFHWVPHEHAVACSQTLYFLFKVRRARVIKYKPREIYWPPAQGGMGGEKKKIDVLYFSFSRSLRSLARQCFRKERKEE